METRHEETTEYQRYFKGEAWLEPDDGGSGAPVRVRVADDGSVAIDFPSPHDGIGDRATLYCASENYSASVALTKIVCLTRQRCEASFDGAAIVRQRRGAARLDCLIPYYIEPLPKSLCLEPSRTHAALVSAAAKASFECAPYNGGIVVCGWRGLDALESAFANLSADGFSVVSDGYIEPCSLAAAHFFLPIAETRLVACIGYVLRCEPIEQLLSEGCKKKTRALLAAHESRFLTTGVFLHLSDRDRDVMGKFTFHERRRAAAAENAARPLIQPKGAPRGRH